MFIWFLFAFYNLYRALRERSLSMCNGGGGGGGGYFIKFEKWFMPHPSFQEITWHPLK